MGTRRFRQKCDARKYLRSESGQSIVLIAMVILSFLMFFSFAINTGLLINAKISVQAAADAAAYAGASTQARQLNAISFLNYDMRRQYKKFLFRYVFVGSMGSPAFPRDSKDNDQAARYDFPKYDSTLPKFNNHMGKLALKVPVICIPLTTGGTASDNCLSINLPDNASQFSGALGGTGLNSISAALLQTLKDIQSVQNKLCEGQGDMNKFVLLAWLFRGDLNTASLQALLQGLQKQTTGGNPQAPDPGQVAASEAIQGLVEGLGLYPRNILHLMRIQTLETLLNEPHQTDITFEKASAWEKAAGGAEEKERSLQAYKSALANLNADVFDANLLSVSELQADHQVSVNPVLINFNAYVQVMANSQKSNTICNSTILPFTALGAPVGVTLMPGWKTNYAVKVRAFIKPRGLLFLPGSEALELSAVAGAKPFGSRIGPSQLSASDLTEDIVPPDLDDQKPMCLDGGSAAQCRVPSLAIGGGATAFSTAYLKDLTLKAKQGGAAFTSEGIRTAQRHAIAPNPQEVGHYNILPPPKPQSEMRYEFIQYANSEASTDYHFYAPIFPSGNGDPNQKVDAFLEKMFQKTEVGNSNPFKINMAEMRQQIGDAIKLYIANSLPTGKSSELNETTTFAAIDLPMARITPSQGYWLTRADQVLSSWGPQYSRIGGGNTDSVGFRPRFGYSVRFATLQNLMSEGVVDEDGDLGKTNH